MYYLNINTIHKYKIFVTILSTRTRKGLHELEGRRNISGCKGRGGLEYKWALIKFDVKEAAKNDELWNKIGEREAKAIELMEK